jgi:transcriptional/translational regulatory protein YebC/TACO1
MSRHHLAEIFGYLGRAPSTQLLRHVNSKNLPPRRVSLTAFSGSCHPSMSVPMDGVFTKQVIFQHHARKPVPQKRRCLTTTTAPIPQNKRWFPTTTAGLCFQRPPSVTLGQRFPQNKSVSIISSCQIRWFAGHNKWSKIKHKKGANDAARAKQHAKASKAIQVASRNCNGDMENLELQSAISSAKSVQLPKDRITAAVDRGTSSHKDSSNADQMHVLRYDAQVSIKDEDGHSHKVAFIIMTLTDNRNRTFGRLRGIMSKNEGEMIPTGQHDWMFEQVGIVIIECNATHNTAEDEDETLEKVMDCTLEQGATDVEWLQSEDEGEGENDDSDGSKSSSLVVTCIPSSLHAVLQSLQKEGFELSQFGIHYQLKEADVHCVPLPVPLLQHMVDTLDDDEEVTNVYHNAQLI